MELSRDLLLTILDYARQSASLWEEVKKLCR